MARRATSDFAKGLSDRSRTRYRTGWLILLLVTVVPARPQPVQTVERTYSAFSEDPAHRFDFWIGRWDVNLRELQEDLTFADAVSAGARVYSILGGRALLELWDSRPIKSFSLFYYYPQTEQWVGWRYWPRPGLSRMENVRGGFRHGRGDFRGGSLLADVPGLTGYSFSDVTPFSLRWDDRYSTDGGRSWREHWIMEFRRAALEPEWPIPRDPVPTFTDGGLCLAESFRPYESLEGRWRGVGAGLEGYRILDGCALVAFLEAGERPEFLFLTSDPDDGGGGLWKTFVLDDAGVGLRMYGGREVWSELYDGTGEPLAWSLEGDRLEYRRGSAMSASSAAERACWTRDRHQPGDRLRLPA